MEFDFFTMADIAGRVGRPRAAIYADLYDATCPKLEHAYKLGNSKLYEPYAVAAWIPLYLEWVDDAPGRLERAKQARQRVSDEQLKAKLAKDAEAAKWADEQQAAFRESERINRERAETRARLNPPQPAVFMDGGGFK